MRGFLGEQGVAVFLGDLVVIGMDLAECEEAMPVAAEINKGGLKRWFYPRYLGEVDIALDLLAVGRLEVEFFNTVALEHRHPGFFRVARIDKHARCHCNVSRRAGRGHRPGRQREQCF